MWPAEINTSSSNWIHSSSLNQPQPPFQINASRAKYKCLIMKGMRKISLSFLDAGIIQWQLKQLHEIKIWNILLRGHNFQVYCSVSGEGWRLPLLQTPSREKDSICNQPARFSLIQSAYLHVETLQIFTANFLPENGVYALLRFHFMQFHQNEGSRNTSRALQ